MAPEQMFSQLGVGMNLAPFASGLVVSQIVSFRPGRRRTIYFNILNCELHWPYFLLSISIAMFCIVSLTCQVVLVKFSWSNTVLSNLFATFDSFEYSIVTVVQIFVSFGTLLHKKFHCHLLAQSLFRKCDISVFTLFLNYI